MFISTPNESLPQHRVRGRGGGPSRVYQASTTRRYPDSRDDYVIGLHSRYIRQYVDTVCREVSVSIPRVRTRPVRLNLVSRSHECLRPGGGRRDPQFLCPLGNLISLHLPWKVVHPSCLTGSVSGTTRPEHRPEETRLKVVLTREDGRFPSKPRGRYQREEGHLHWHPHPNSRTLETFGIPKPSVHVTLRYGPGGGNRKTTPESQRGHSLTYFTGDHS